MLAPYYHSHGFIPKRFVLVSSFAEKFAKDIDIEDVYLEAIRAAAYKELTERFDVPDSDRATLLLENDEPLIWEWSVLINSSPINSCDLNSQLVITILLEFKLNTPSVTLSKI